ncbi:MAG: hypothetical protein ACRD0C_21810 [Acidimicrobiia bacterium]
MDLWLVFLLLSGVFSLGWALGSALGFQAGKREAEELAELQAELVRSIEAHLAVNDERVVPLVPHGSR